MTGEIRVNKKLSFQACGKFAMGLLLVAVLLFLTMPLVLGSVFSFLVMLLYIPIIVKRIKNEEEVLELGLEGYAEYKERVRYRLIPYIW